MKTKTNSIFAALLILFLSLCSSPNPCACPAEFSQSFSTTVSNLLEMASSSCTVDGDICSDCGHTKNCCYNRNEMPAIASAVTVAVADCDYLCILWSPVNRFCADYFSKESTGAVGNRAPPPALRATLQNLHQKLLV